MNSAEFEEELSNLDTRIRQLKIQYDLYFTGILPRPPIEGRDRLERSFRKLQKAKEMRLAQRFLFNMLLNRWNSFQELWKRRMQTVEEGSRLSPAARRRAAQLAAAEEASTASAPPSRPPRAKGLVARAAVSNARDTNGNLKAFYKAFLEARQEAGNGKHPSYERFCKEIERHAADIRQKNSCERVDFRLYLQGNKVSLKAKPAGKEEEVE